MNTLKKADIVSVILQAALMYIWMMILLPLYGTESYYSVYAFCGMIGLLCLYGNYKRSCCASDTVTLSLMQRISVCGFALLFSMAVTLANYPLLELFEDYPENGLSGLNTVLCILGGFFVGFHILTYLVQRVPFAITSEGRGHGKTLGAIVFLSITLIDLVYLFAVAYPGVLTYDCMNTMGQIFTGEYHNTMPYWHTMTVELFYRIGFAIFRDVNKALAFFTVIQVLFIAACFSYVLVTLYDAGLPAFYLVAVYCLYALQPYNIVYSVTQWKDVLFSVGGMLMVTSLFRILRNIGGSEVRNYLVFAAGSIGFCLWRTNGWYAFVCLTLLLFFLLRRQNPRLLWIMLAIVIFCWVLINPLLVLLGVEETDLIEALAIPFQQIARVIANDCYITEEERELLSVAFDLDLVKSLYLPYLSNPIKFDAMHRENLPLIQEHLWEYVRLWLRLGRRHTVEYLKAWIEQTKGYWNGGYSYWIYAEGVYENSFGIVNTGNPALTAWFQRLFDNIMRMEFLRPLYAIGLHVWMLITCFAVNLLCGRKEFVLTIPIIVVIAGLWLATPVAYEFRYAYPMFLSLPVITATLFYQE